MKQHLVKRKDKCKENCRKLHNDWLDWKVRNRWVNLFLLMYCIRCNIVNCTFVYWLWSWDLVCSSSALWQKAPWFSEMIQSICLFHQEVTKAGSLLQWPGPKPNCFSQDMTHHWVIRTRLHFWVCTCCTVRFLRVALVGFWILCWVWEVAF